MTSSTPPVPAGELRKKIAKKLEFLEPIPSNYADEAGYNDASGDYEFLVDELVTIFASTMLSVIGEDMGFVATDDLIKENSVSWAIQMRVKEQQRTRLNEVLGKK